MIRGQRTFSRNLLVTVPNSRQALSRIENFATDADSMALVKQIRKVVEVVRVFSTGRELGASHSEKTLESLFHCLLRCPTRLIMSAGYHAGSGLVIVSTGHAKKFVDR